MKTVRRLLYRDIVSSVLFVAVAFLSLFFFIDFVDELEDIGKKGYTALHAALSSLMEVPGHFYELFPIAVLIGTIFSLARMAQSTEYTILRTGGLGPERALRLLALLGLAFAVCTFIVGDYVAPATEREAVLLKAQFTGGRQLGRSGAWLKDKRHTPQGERSYSINVAQTSPEGALAGIRIYEFDTQGRLLTRVQAAAGRVDEQGVWQLQDVQLTRWPAQPADDARVQEQRLPTFQWASSLKADVVAAAVLPASTMSTIELWRYTSHLNQQEQAAQRYAIQFWKKALYPFACLVMVALALPFAYLHARSGGISLKVFGGILLGISFVLLNNVAGHLGLLHDWKPWAVAAAPSLLFLLLSLAAFAWLVRYR
ncbi:MAG: LPS export ABC transporter permease LptG [Pseudomonadota bacterium]